MADAKPTILIFSRESVEDDFGKSNEIVNFRRAGFTKRQVTKKLLDDHPSAQAIWILDCDIVNPFYKVLSKKVVDYVHNGGIAILGGWFSASVNPSDFDRWMEDAWKLPWRYGQYETTTVVFQTSAVGPYDHWCDGLPASYSQKGVFLKNVAPSDSWYASPPGSISESVSGEVPVKAETSIAFGKVGMGWLGWTGEVSSSLETAAAVRAMMGMNKGSDDDLEQLSQQLYRMTLG
ncbi:hypothetical protein AAE478_006877 [Parahypoxylon ruwenzoriense]